MTDRRSIEPLVHPPDADVMVPGSKSITNRALVCAALATGTSMLDGFLTADDTGAMVDCLSGLGAEIVAGKTTGITPGITPEVTPDKAVEDQERNLRIVGTGGRLLSGPLSLDARLSGTTARFVLPMLLLGSGPYELDGAEPLRLRPMADGIAAVRSLGAAVVELSQPGHLPVMVTPEPDSVSTSWFSSGPSEAAVVRVRGDVSSQFLSGLLMIGPCLTSGLTIKVDGPLVSLPYVEMTASVMRSFGATVNTSTPGSFVVEPGGYQAATYRIEPDASAASYFFAAAAISGGRVRINGLGTSSMQGDLGFVRVLEQMGAEVTMTDSFTEVFGPDRLVGVDVDMGDLSDTAQTLAVTAAFAEGPTRITGIGFIRNKETDRIAATVAELRRCGVDARETDDGIEVHPIKHQGSQRRGNQPHGAVIRTYDDHRMAMSFSLIGLQVPGMEIDDPGCVAKTFPSFFDVLDDLRSARGTGSSGQEGIG